MFYLLVGITAVIAYLLYVTCMKELDMENRNSLIKEWLIVTPKRTGMLGIYIIMSLCFVKLFYFFGYGPVKIIKYCILLGGLVPIAYEDYREKKIPNRWLLYLLILRIILFMIESCLYPAAIWNNIMFTASGGIISGMIMLIAYIISRHQIGLGDVKVFAVIGIFLGTTVTYFVIFTSLLIAAVYSGINILRKKLKAKDEIAFGPFILMGTLLILALGF